MIPRIKFDLINFGYKSKLKDEFKKGNIPLEKGFYGGKLDPKNASLEHCKPHSKGGKNTLGNFVLATVENNNKRGNGDIFRYATKENTEAYFKVFENCNIKDTKGTDYLKMLAKTLRELWEKSPIMKGKEMWEVLKRW
ncbi:MAG: hypothetical protein IKU37_09010 [Candidatus Gastranaerophilales bacterium]|nr:hypothetical protein [Candidatus Gastranaerophilales bacterium]